MVYGHKYSPGETGLKTNKANTDNVILQYTIKTRGRKPNYQRYQCPCGYNTNRNGNYKLHKEICQK